jgi:hypothetical protein
MQNGEVGNKLPIDDKEISPCDGIKEKIFV